MGNRGSTHIRKRQESAPLRVSKEVSPGSRPKPPQPNQLYPERRQSVSERLSSKPGSLPSALIKDIKDNPLFSIMTENRSHWFDPFSGAPVAIPEGTTSFKKFIAQHLLAADTWRRYDCIEELTLRTQCWRLDLLRLFRKDKRFRLFSSRDGAWMNPYTGNIVDHIRRPDDGVIDQQTITKMARYLAECGISTHQEPLSPELLRRTMTSIYRERDAEARSAEFAPVQDEDKEDLNRDLDRATAVQAQMLQEPPSLPGFDIARFFRPHAAVSGDAYDMHVDETGKFHFLIADVAGHGLQGAIISAGLMRTVRLLRRSIYDPKDILIALNAELKPELLPGQFVTVCAGTLDTSTNVMQVCLAGHHPCMVLNPHADIVVSRLGQPGMVLGIVDGDQFAQSLSTEEIQLSPGDMVVQCTDGIIEATNGKSEYGIMRMASRMLLKREAGQDAQGILNDAVDAAELFCDGNLGDDVTLIAIAANEETS